MATPTSTCPHRPARGTALIVALAIVILLASMCTVLLTEMRNRSRHVEVDLEDIKAFEAAEAGLDAALRDINQTKPVRLHVPWPNGPAVSSPEGRPITIHNPRKSPGCLGTRVDAMAGTQAWDPNTDDWNHDGRPTWQLSPLIDRVSGKGIFDPVTGLEALHEPNIVPLQLGDVGFFTYAIHWISDGVDNNGDGQIDDVAERNKYTIYSTGIHKGIAKTGITESGKVVTVEAIVDALDEDVPTIPTAALTLNLKPKVPAP